MKQDGTLLGGFTCNHTAGTIGQTHGNPSAGSGQALYSQTVTDAVRRVTQVGSTQVKSRTSAY